MIDKEYIERVTERLKNRISFDQETEEFSVYMEVYIGFERLKIQIQDKEEISEQRRLDKQIKESQLELVDMQRRELCKQMGLVYEQVKEVKEQMDKHKEEDKEEDKDDK